MARELKELRKFDFARRLVLIQVQDEFGTVTPHTIPLTGDICPHCGSNLPGAQGARDVDASAAAAVARIDKHTDDSLPVLEKAAHSNPEALAIILNVKAKRAAAKSNNAPGTSVPGVPTNPSAPGGGST